MGARVGERQEQLIHVRCWLASDRLPAFKPSYFGLLCHFEGIVDLNTEIANRAF